jgi:hypothetical protein
MGPIASFIPLSFPKVSTYFTPFTISFSLSLGSTGLPVDNQQQPVESQDSETYIPQTLVVGIFLAIFVAQVAANGFQILRSRRQGRIGTPLNVQTEQETLRTPAELQDEGEG